MSMLKSLTRRKSGGTLGIVNRSIGYLQGGYKDSTIHSRVQLFNTTTQTGSIVYDTGYARYYTPGMSGNNNGYFSINNNTDFNKFSYIAASASSSFTMPQYPQTSASDFGIYSVGWMLSSTAGATWGQYGTTGWSSVPFNTEAVTNYGNLSASPMGTTRQSPSTAFCAIFLNNDYVSLTILNFSNNALTTDAGNSSLCNGGIQIPVGMCRSNTIAYIVGFSPFNMKMTLSGASITAFAQETSYTYNFGESHSVTSSTDGYMMAGYNDTTGKYGGSQHGLCQKITFSNSAVTTLSDLVLPQSSGQMMQGF
jgi:hypothetical protein